MKKLVSTLILLSSALCASAQVTPQSQMERLDRGLVALPSQGSSHVFLSWRMLGTDDEERTSFDVYRDGTRIAKDLYKTNFEYTAGKTGSFVVVTKVDGEPVDTSAAVTPWAEPFLRIKLDRPAGGTIDGGAYTYSPNDCSVGDVDGDGRYELFVKWDPSNSKDNSQSGYTGNVYLDCYRLDGTRLWRIDLGPNIRAGAHYTQFQVYDYDGDGRAELICKTGPGSIDGQGNYVNQAATDATIRSASNTKDWRVSGGRVNGGQEYLTVFNGLTGAAVHTIFYNPNRNQTYGGDAAGTFNWGTPDGKNDTGTYGNRGERFLAATAYIDGPDKPASGIFSRGYYGYAMIWAVSFDGKQLRQRWLHNSNSKTTYKLTTYDADGKGTTQSFSGLKPTGLSTGSGTMFANGNHNLSIADVDGDGCDEIIWGSAALDHNGRLLYGTGFGHGDAIHLADHCPDRPGLEVFQVHEEKGTYAWDLHDAATGEIIFKGGPAGVDNGRGMAGNFDFAHRGSLFSSSSERQQRSAVTGEVFSTGQTSLNFRIYWDGDLQEELFDGGKIDKWNGNGTTRLYLNGENLYGYNSSSTCNGTKSTPCLQADIFGDWREEVILWSSADNATLNVFTTNTATDYRLPTLMHDHVYRMGICWQNTAYNQPPHLGYYLPDSLKAKLTNPVREISVPVGSLVEFQSGSRLTRYITLTASITPDGKKVAYDVPSGFDLIYDGNENWRDDDDIMPKSILIKGTPSVEGDYKFVVGVYGIITGETYSDTIVVHAIDPSGVSSTYVGGETIVGYYDVSGRRLSVTEAARHKGVVIVRRQTASGVTNRKEVRRK